MGSSVEQEAEWMEKNERGLAFSKRGLPDQGSQGIDDPTHVSRMSHEGT